VIAIKRLAKRYGGDRAVQRIDIGSLFDETARPQVDGAAHGCWIDQGGKDEDTRLRNILGESRNHLESVQVGQADIEDQHLRAQAAALFQDVYALRGLANDYIAGGGGKVARKQLAKRRVVLSDED